jgi:hypothetical protein
VSAYKRLTQTMGNLDHGSNSSAIASLTPRAIIFSFCYAQHDLSPGSRRLVALLEITGTVADTEPVRLFGPELKGEELSGLICQSVLS